MAITSVLRNVRKHLHMPHHFRTTYNTSPMQSPEPTGSPQPVILRRDKHQDTIAVNSIEGNDDCEKKLRGIDHYLYTIRYLGIDNKPSVDQIDYRYLGATSDSPVSHFALPIKASPVPSGNPPSPPAPSTYANSIYMGRTHNPAIFLSILHIAQQNLPHLNLNSALSHIPNLGPTDRIPLLFPSTPGDIMPQPFLDASTVPKRSTDENVTIAFLPWFYNSGEQHAIGFYKTLVCPSRGRVIGTAIFTPCSEIDLRRYGLVRYAEGWWDGRGDDGLEDMEAVGCEEGGWVEWDIEEEKETWKAILRVAQVVWEGRMALVCKGKMEG